MFKEMWDNMYTEKKKKQILIVDDEEVNREILKEMFRDGTYELIEAEDGEAAIEKLKTNARMFPCFCASRFHNRAERFNHKLGILTDLLLLLPDFFFLLFQALY